MSSQTGDNTDKQTKILIEKDSMNDNEQKPENIDNTAEADEDNNEEKIDFNRQPSIMRQLTNVNDNRDIRFSTTLLNTNESELKEVESEKEEIFEYGFGAPFSYWPEYTYYPYAPAKYKTLKEELLNNTINAITQEEYNQVTVKAKTSHVNIRHILGQGIDKNTPYARYNEQLNKIFKIEHKELISFAHIQSILFYTDLSSLPRKMKNVCRKLNNEETIDDVKKRHCELVNWLKLLFETIVMYGNKFGTTENQTVYHGLNRKFYFREFKAKFYIPTSATTEIAIASNFAEGNGIILEFCGLESIGDPYFDTASLSAYPNEKEYLFFFAELPIKSVYISINKFDLAPLSLYQTIINGNVMIDREQLKKKQYNKTQSKLNKYLDILQLQDDDQKEMMDTLDEVEQYGINLLKSFIKYNKIIRINKQEIISKITMAKLRQKFIEQNEDKTFKRYSTSLRQLIDINELQIKNSDSFTWNNTNDDIINFLGDDGYCCSKVFRCNDKAKFYCQMNKMDDENGRITLILYKLKGKTQKTVSFDIYCKQMNKFYVRFHQICFKLDGEEDDARQGAEFKLEWIKKAQKKAQQKGNDIEWKITIGE